MAQQEPMVSIDFDDSAGARPMAFSEVRRTIHELLNATNFGLAASLSAQLADQLPQELQPQLIAAEMHYLHQQMGPAFRYIDRALEIDPENIVGLVVKSRLFLYASDPERALQLIDSAIKLTPQDSRLQSVRGDILTAAGRIDAARESFLKSIELDSRNADALLGLSHLPGDNFSNQLIRSAELLVRSGRLRSEYQIKAHFALATAHEKKSDFARQFAQLKAGNALKSRSLGFDADATAREARIIIEYFSGDFFARRPITDGDPANVIFIVGFPRCGSTLVEQILSSHPLVSAAGEVYALPHALRDTEKSERFSTGYPHWFGELPPETLTNIADGYLRKVRQFNRSEWLTDKNLENYKFVGVIHLIFPNAKIVNVLRNPIDTCFSCYKRLFDHNSLPFTYSLDDLASAYRSYRDIIRHWDAVLPGRVLSMDYESLVTNQRTATKELLEFCGLPWDDACLDFHRNERIVQTASNIQVRRPLYNESIDRWKNYAEHLGPLLDLTD